MLTHIRTRWAPIVACSLAAAASADVVLTENFESPAVPDFRTYAAGETLTTVGNAWAVTQTGIDLFNGNARGEADAYDGVQAVDLAGSPGEGVMSTTFIATPGRTYQLVLHYARNNNIGGGVAQALVEVVDSKGARLSETITHDLSRYPFSQFIELRRSFTVTESTLTLRLTSQTAGFAGIVVDAIEISGITCRADFNGDFVVNSQDFFDFLGAFFSASPSADFNVDSVVNSQDFFDFLVAFFEGCA